MASTGSDSSAHRLPARVSWRAGVTACVGVFVVIAVLAYVSFDLHTLLVLGSFGSSAVLLFAFPENHFCQPRNFIGGHVICTAVGLAALQFCGGHWWSLGLAVAASAGVMMAARMIHPPAGSNPIIVFLAKPGWDFVLWPTLLGAATMVAVAVVYHRSTRKRYPNYWWN